MLFTATLSPIDNLLVFEYEVHGRYICTGIQMYTWIVQRTEIGKLM